MEKNDSLADWTKFEFAIANHEMNKGYFENNECDKYESYYKIKELLKWIISQENGFLSMLDIGCGSGWQAEYLRRAGFFDNIKYTGMDISQHMCNFAAQNCPPATFIVGDLLNFGFNETYDIVYEAALMDCMIDWKLAVKNMSQLSKKWLVFHRLFHTEGETKIEQVKIYNEKPDLRIYIGINDLKNELHNNGFEMSHKDVWQTEPYRMGYFIFKRA